jgi:excinuclease UvrABC ATPase subunit
MKQTLNQTYEQIEQAYKTIHESNLPQIIKDTLQFNKIKPTQPPTLNFTNHTHKTSINTQNNTITAQNYQDTQNDPTYKPINKLINFTYHEHKQAHEQSQTRWESQHQTCPNCHSNNITQTLAGPIGLPGHPYYDPNTAICTNCNWTGKCIQLQPPN